MSQPTAQEYKPLRDFAGRVPGQKNGSRKHISSLIRYALKGVTAPDGRQVKLQAIRLGHRWLCTDAWWSDFLAALTTSPTDPAADTTRSPHQRSRAAEQAEAELVARGC
jgi:hypothetical protein